MLYNLKSDHQNMKGLSMKARTLLYIVILFTLGCALPSGIPKDGHLYELMIKAEQGHAESQYQLGMMYTLQGKWLWDYQEGYGWFLKAAKGGHVEAKYMAGIGKTLGRGTEKDLSGAANLFAQAAKMGHPRAQYQFGMAHLNGAGVQKDKYWGRQWIEQAAWNNHKNSQFILGALFASGVGGQSNQVEAWHWLKRADLNGHPKAEQALRTLGEKITSRQKAQGELLLSKKVGSSGLYPKPRVRYVQSVLNKMGYAAGKEDGELGPATTGAVSNYALKNKLAAEVQINELIEILRTSN